MCAGWHTGSSYPTPFVRDCHKVEMQKSIHLGMEEVPAEDVLRVYGGCRDFEKVRRWVDMNYSCMA